MSAQVLDGRILARVFGEELKSRIKSLPHKPLLYAVNLLKDPSIESYALSQQKAAANVGIDYVRVDAAGKSQDDVIALLREILKNPHAAIFIFKPVPADLDFKAINDRIHDLRNIEGIYPFNLGLFFLSWKGMISPPTPAAAVALLKSANVPLKGKNAVILGRSETVGKPLMHLLLAEDMTVTVCHSKTPREILISMVRSSDVVCACLGQPHFVKKEWIKPGAIVIDIGINSVDGKIVGDVSPDVSEAAGYLSPVPGGVGPITSIFLMRNVVNVLERT